MKRTVSIICILIVFMLLFACQPNTIKNLSEVRDGYFEAADNNFVVKAISGQRENPYIMDGVSGELTDYTLITLEPKVFTKGKAYGYHIKSGENELSGTFIPHPFAQSYSAELPIRISGENFALIVVDGKIMHSFNVISFVTTDMINYKRAVDLAYERLRDSVKSMNSYEIYTRLIKNPLTGEGLNWYVSFYGESTFSVLINPVTCKIEAVRE